MNEGIQLSRISTPSTTLHSQRVFTAILKLLIRLNEQSCCPQKLEKRYQVLGRFSR